MLYMIYGLTSVVGARARQYFAERGVEVVQKLTYETENVRVRPAIGQLKRAITKEEVLACDYVYENHGRIVGFTLDQIIDALNGKKDCLLTFSADSVELLEQIKATYRHRVVSIFAYIDKRQLEELTANLPREVSEEEIHHRLEMGHAVKKCYLQNQAMFDETVIYGGEETLFDLDAFCDQLGHIIEKYKNAAKDLIDLPYMGDKPYIFVSYARADTEKVVPILQFLQSHGCRIWYDVGIKGGENWVNLLANKIADCTQYIVFSSQNAAASKWTHREILQADDADKPTIVVRMDGARLQSGAEMCIVESQQVFCSHEHFETELLQSIDRRVIESFGRSEGDEAAAASTEAL